MKDVYFDKNVLIRKANAKETSDSLRTKGRITTSAFGEQIQRLNHREFAITKQSVTIIDFISNCLLSFKSIEQ